MAEHRTDAHSSTRMWPAAPPDSGGGIQLVTIAIAIVITMSVKLIAITVR